MSGHKQLPSRVSALGLTLSAFVIAACGGGDDSSNDGANAAQAAPGSTVEPAASAAPVATDPVAPPAMPVGAPTPPADDTGFLDDPNAASMMETVELNDDTACAGLELIPEEVEVEVPMDITTTTEVLQPVAFYFILDNSSSMRNELPDVVDAIPDPNEEAADPATDPEAPDPEASEPAADPNAADPNAADPNAADPNAADPGTDVADPTAAVPTTRWEMAVSSMQAFVTSPDSEGLDVAIQYFNPSGEGQQGGGQQGGNDNVDDPLCDGTFHQTPDVEMGQLPGHSPALVDSLTVAETVTGTPTLGALTGGIAYCEAFEAANPEENCVVVLMTDGAPSSCGLGGDNATATDTLTTLAAAGLAAGIETFTVGMDGVNQEGFALLDAVALAGGTDCTPDSAGAESCNVSSTGSQGLVETLNSIRDTVTVTETVTEVTTVVETQKLDCQWLLPEPPEEDGSIDPDRVNVNLSLDGAEPELIPSVDDEAACTSNAGVGWYYDDVEAPTTIFACNESCSQIQDGINPSVNILLGCERVTIQVMR